MYTGSPSKQAVVGSSLRGDLLMERSHRGRSIATLSFNAPFQTVVYALRSNVPVCSLLQDILDVQGARRPGMASQQKATQFVCRCWVNLNLGSSRTIHRRRISNLRSSLLSSKKAATAPIMTICICVRVLLPIYARRSPLILNAKRAIQSRIHAFSVTPTLPPALRCCKMLFWLP